MLDITTKPKIKVPDEMKNSVQKYIASEKKYEQTLGFKIPQNKNVIQYFGIDKLVSCILEFKSNQHSKEIDGFSKSYTPVRNALAHTRLLTAEAKQHLNNTFLKIKENLKKLLSNE